MIVTYNDVFKIPILYNEKVQKLNKNIITDLELVQTVDCEETPIYDNVFKPSNKASSQVLQQIAKYYTTDVKYLKETQQMTKQINLEELNTIHNKYGFNHFDINDIISLWDEIHNDNGFCEKYLYINWDFAKQLNNNITFLHLNSLYNIASPILSLCLPIMVFIIPFIIIKLKGIELGITQYIDILKSLIKHHSIFKIFTQFNEISNSEKAYLLLSSAFYLFSIYQNILVCIKFYSNMQKIHNYIFKIKNYLSYSVSLMDYFVSSTNNYNEYKHFNNDIVKYKHSLSCLLCELSKITPFTFSFSKIFEIGDIMYNFYQIYDNIEYHRAVYYSFGFNGYMNTLYSTTTNINETKLVKTSYTNKGKPRFKNMYYPKFINNDPSSIIKNNCNLSKNIIITGPNASGKTTTLKTILINIILSQQIGYGCFEQLKLTPFDKLHSYLNIPDTSGRDSLFQAEARRCKEIIDCINEDVQKTHFCIFDELYSGTNPEEAIISANAFMNYIVSNKNVSCILTTHYIKLCKKLSKNDIVKNYNMKTIKTLDNFEYTYKLKKGISDVKGGLKVLQDMKYPKELLNFTK
jgi:hypothetical protein